VIEKIYKKQISPLLKKPAIKILVKIPGLNQLLFSKIKSKLVNVFGGNFTELVIGGAALSHETEQFFRKIGFPFTIGYGMTECGPLISYSGWKKFKLESAGKTVDSLEARIDSADPERIEGEILVRGENVMDGYFKNEKATEEVLGKDGWLHTGDMGLIDKDGVIFIKGRVKNMILGSSGQNIYPEEIVINNFRYVVESLVVEKKGKLVAMVHFNYEELEKRFQHLKGEVENFMEDKIEDLKAELHAYINARVNKFSRVQLVVVHPTPFHKTATHKIKRFMYS